MLFLSSLLSWNIRFLQHSQFEWIFCTATCTNRKCDIGNTPSLLSYSSDITPTQILQTIALDGGSFRLASGEFNGLMYMSSEQWDNVEKRIRKTTSKDKALMKAKLWSDLFILDIGYWHLGIKLINIDKWLIKTSLSMWAGGCCLYGTCAYVYICMPIIIKFMFGNSYLRETTDR